MTYLTRIILNPRSRQVHNELADPYEMHRTVTKAFAGNLQDDERVLFRVDVPRTGVPTLLVQSRYEPNWAELTEARKNYLLDESYLPFGVENLALKEIDFSQKLRAGQRLAFRLRANPIKRIKESRKRVGLYKEEEQLDWLKRKLSHENAAQLLSARVSKESDQHGKLFKEKDKKKRMKFHAILFEGILEITNQAEFQKMLEGGIGPGKGLGFGLLSLAPNRG
jgi:CRISPR system Cascade subunit CasE